MENQLNMKVNFHQLPLIGTTIFKPSGFCTLEICLVNCEFFLHFSLVIRMGIIPQHPVVIWALNQQNHLLKDFAK